MDLVWNSMGGLAMAGLGVTLFNIGSAIFLGMAITWLILCGMLILSLSEMNTEQGIWNLMNHILLTSGNIIALLCLVGFYTGCVLQNREYISDYSMPDSWYLFSYFVVVVTGLNVLALVQYHKTKEENYNTLAILLSTILLGFVIIETIICSYFRTDGFTV